MNFNSLREQIKEDTNIDFSDIPAAIGKKTKVLGKYIDLMFFNERLLNSFNKQYNILKKDKMIYYRTEFHLIPTTQKELTTLIEGDSDLCELKEKIDNIETLLKYLDNAVKTLRERTWDIRAYVDFNKYQSGS